MFKHLLALLFVAHSSIAFAKSNTASPMWKHGDNECPAASATDRYIDVPVFHDLDNVARMDRIPGLNNFSGMQIKYQNKKIRVYYETYRPWDPAKKLLILIPGGPSQPHADLHSLVDLFEEKSELLKQFNIIAMDHRGVGCSRPMYPGNEPAESMMMRQAASDIEMIRRELVGATGKINVWGYSYGSILAQTYALLYPDQIERFSIGGAVSKMEDFNFVGVQYESLVYSAVPNADRITLETYLNPDPQLKDAFFAWAFGPLYNFKGRTEAIPKKVKELNEMLKNGQKDLVMKGFESKELEVAGWMQRSIACLELFPYETKYPNEYPIWPMIMKSCSDYKNGHEYFNYTPLLRQITAPTFIYGGAFDHVTPSRAMIEIAREIPGSFLFIDNYVSHGFSGKEDCFVELTVKFFMGASNQELQQISYSPACQMAPVEKTKIGPK